MSFPKFTEWLSFKENEGNQMQKNKASEQEIKKVTASLVGEPKEKRKSALKQLAQKKAMDPSSSPKDIAAIASAAEESS